MNRNKIIFFLIILCVLSWYFNTWDVYEHNEFLFDSTTKNLIFTNIVKSIVLFCLFFIIIKDQSLNSSYSYCFGKFFFIYPQAWRSICNNLKPYRLGKKILLKLLLKYIQHYNFFRISEKPEYPDKMFYLKLILLFIWILMCIQV